MEVTEDEKVEGLIQSVTQQQFHIDDNVMYEIEKGIQDSMKALHGLDEPGFLDKVIAEASSTDIKQMITDVANLPFASNKFKKLVKTCHVVLPFILKLPAFGKACDKIQQNVQAKFAVQFVKQFRSITKADMVAQFV